MRLGIDADRGDVPGVREGGRPVAGAMGHAAGHPGRPARRPTGAGQDGRGGESELAERLPRAPPRRAELEAAAGHGLAQQRLFLRIEPHVREVIECLHRDHLGRHNLVKHVHQRLSPTATTVRPLRHPPVQVGTLLGWVSCHRHRIWA